MANNQEQVAQQAEDQPQKIVIKSKRWLPLESDPELVSSPQLTVMRLPASPKWMSHPTRTFQQFHFRSRLDHSIVPCLTFDNGSPLAWAVPHHLA